MALEFKDYYGILGVPRTATDDEVKKAFRRLAREHHPDVAKDKKRSEERFKEINEAYEVLGNAENRRKYDELGPDWKQGPRFRPPPGSGRRRSARGGASPEDVEFQFGGTGFSDFFEALFGGRSRGGFGGGEFDSRQGGFEGGRGGDLESDILVTLDEVVKGSVRTITEQRVNPEDGSVDENRFQVRIPAGVRDGQLIRVAGKGQPGRTGSGDLLLRVRVERHPDFSVRGSDLESEAVLAPWEAVLGSTIRVTTLEGQVTVRVPAGSHAGQRLRVRGHGLPIHGGGRGDLYVTLTVDVPTSVGEEERALWAKLAETSRFRPRGDD